MEFLIKILCVLLCTFSFQRGNAQNIEIDKCGMDKIPLLNEYEAGYFNEILKEERGCFDFEGKRVAFASGNWGARKSDKQAYFEQYGKPRFEQNQTVVNQLILFDEAEKALQPNYDAIIVSWSKITVMGKARKRLVRRL